MATKNREHPSYLKYRREINTGEPINHNGYILQPFTMKDVYTFDTLKYFLVLSKNDVLQSMGVKYIKLPYMTRLNQFDEDCVNENKKCQYMFSALLTVLAIALGIYDESTWVSQNPFLVFKEQEKIAIQYKCPITAEIKTISEQEITEIREIIAIQNAFELPDLTENPMLKQQHEQLKKMDSTVEIYADIDTKMNNVCWDLRLRRKDIDEWTIFEFNAMADVGIHREEYRTLATAEFKDKSNPYVHPYYPAKPQEETYGLVDINSANTDMMANHN